MKHALVSPDSDYKTSEFFLKIVFLAVGLVAITCNQAGKAPEMKPEPRYYSEKEEGKWKNMSDTHIPRVEFTGADTIVVKVPLIPSRDPRHYIEVIALAEGENKQIAAKKFNDTSTEYSTEFKIPSSKKQYYVVSKCNLHDMWRIPVIKK